MPVMRCPRCFRAGNRKRRMLVRLIGLDNVPRQSMGKHVYKCFVGSEFNVSWQALSTRSKVKFWEWFYNLVPWTPWGTLYKQCTCHVVANQQTWLWIKMCFLFCVRVYSLVKRNASVLYPVNVITPSALHRQTKHTHLWNKTETLLTFSLHQHSVQACHRLSAIMCLEMLHSLNLLDSVT